ncbi:MAG: TRC40/GET3/ArsA family transport-energizing ATPase [Candidatus Manganitrophaceae bacterium]
MRIVLFTGKGGVGKTTLAAATSLRAAALGHRTLVMSTDIAHSLADSFGIPLSNTPTQIGPPGLFAAEFDTGEELERYWGDVKRRIATVLREEGLEAAIAGEMAILPGLDELLSLVRIKKYFDEAPFDLLIIDSAPTGAAMRLLSAPDLNRWYLKNVLHLTQGISKMILPVIQSMIRWPVTEQTLQDKITKLFNQVEDLRRIFTDPDLTSVRLVLNPDRMSLLETERALTFFSLFGLSVDAMFVNRVLPQEVADPYLEEWKKSQTEYRRQIAEMFSPLPIFEVPLMRQEVTGIDRLKPLAESLYGDKDPAKRLSEVQSMRFDLREGKYTLSLQVAGVQGREIDLEKNGDELRVQIGRFKRTIALPQYVAGLQPTSARLDEGTLKVVFEE